MWGVCMNPIKPFPKRIKLGYKKITEDFVHVDQYVAWMVKEHIAWLADVRKEIKDIYWYHEGKEAEYKIKDLFDEET